MSTNACTISPEPSCSSVAKGRLSHHLCSCEPYFLEQHSATHHSSKGKEKSPMLPKLSYLLQLCKMASANLFAPRAKKARTSKNRKAAKVTKGGDTNKNPVVDRQTPALQVVNPVDPVGPGLAPPTTAAQPATLQPAVPTTAALQPPQPQGLTTTAPPTTR